MSLDVCLTMPSRTTSDGRIYVRRDGQTVEVTRSEWDEMYPGREPATVLSRRDDGCRFDGNITHNLGQMAREVGIYEQMWHPERVGITHARQLIEPLRDGLARLNSDYERLQQFNPPNGWGSYDTLLLFTADYLAACEQWPDAEVWASA